jgi:hypothetical protein
MLHVHARKELQKAAEGDHSKRYALTISVLLCQKHFLSKAAPHYTSILVKGDRTRRVILQHEFYSSHSLVKMKWTHANYKLTHYQTPRQRWFPANSMLKEALSHHDKNCTQCDSMWKIYHILASKQSVIMINCSHIYTHTYTWYYQCSNLSRMFNYSGFALLRKLLLTISHTHLNRFYTSVLGKRKIQLTWLPA